MSWEVWVLGIVASVIVLTIVYFAKIINDLPNTYMPRPQIIDRFRDIEQRLHADHQALQASMQGVEDRTDRRLDRMDGKLDTMDGKLDRIFDRLAGKADRDWQPGDAERRR